MKQAIKTKQVNELKVGDSFRLIGARKFYEIASINKVPQNTPVTDHKGGLIISYYDSRTWCRQRVLKPILEVEVL